MTFIFHVVLIGTNFKNCDVIVPMEDFILLFMFNAMQGIKYSFMHISKYQQYICDINMIKTNVFHNVHNYAKLILEMLEWNLK